MGDVWNTILKYFENKKNHFGSKSDPYFQYNIVQIFIFSQIVKIKIIIKSKLLKLSSVCGI